MQCRLPRKGAKLIFDVVISGDFSLMSPVSVTIDGMTYKSEQTLKVAKGTNATVYCGSSLTSYYDSTYIRLNGVEVARGVDGESGAEYTFSVTDNCLIEFSVFGNAYRANITMPA